MMLLPPPIHLVVVLAILASNYPASGEHERLQRSLETVSANWIFLIGGKVYT